MNFSSNSWTLSHSTCILLTSRTKRIYLEVNNHERIKIRKLYLGNITDTDAELETNFTSQTPFYNEFLASSFISYFTVQEKEWL